MYPSLSLPCLRRASSARQVGVSGSLRGTRRYIPLPPGTATPCRIRQGFLALDTPFASVVGRFIRRNGHFNVSERIGPFRVHRTVVDAELGLVHRHELETDHILARSIERIGITRTWTAWWTWSRSPCQSRSIRSPLVNAWRTGCRREGSNTHQLTTVVGTKKVLRVGSVLLESDDDGASSLRQSSYMSPRIVGNEHLDVLLAAWKCAACGATFPAASPILARDSSPVA